MHMHGEDPSTLVGNANGIARARPRFTNLRLIRDRLIKRIIDGADRDDGHNRLGRRQIWTAFRAYPLFQALFPPPLCLRFPNQPFFTDDDYYTAIQRYTTGGAHPVQASLLSR
jgi:hypothetical protein